MANRLTAPPAVIAQWPQPNYFNPETKGLSLQWLSIALSGIALLAIVLRCYTRIFITRAFGADDAFIIISLALCIAFSAILIWGIRDWYLGYHIWDLPAHSVVDHRKGTWVASFMIIFASCSIRISVLLFYRRLSVSFPRGFLIASWVGIGYNLGLMLGLCLANIFICWPIQAYWNRYDLDWRASHKWKCGNEGLSLPISGVLMVAGDLYCTILPLVLVVTLKLPRQQKVALFFLFGLGFFVCGAGATRITLLSLVVWKTYDFTWKIYDMWVWSSVELYIGILVACAPSLKPLVRMAIGSNFLGYVYAYGSSKYADSSPNNGKSQYVVSSSVPGEWNSTHHEMVDQTPNLRSSYRLETESKLAKITSAVSRTLSFVSNVSSNQDQASIESFPRKPRQVRTNETETPIMKGGCKRSVPQASYVDVDPPIFPASIVVRPLGQPDRPSLFIGDGLPQQRQDHAHLTLPRSADNSLSGLSSPVPTGNQILAINGWVELRPVTDQPGNVAVARVRASPHQTRPMSPLPTKPMYDAEGSHTGFAATPLPRSPAQPRRSEDMTRLNYSESSGSTQGVNSRLI